MQHNSLTDRMSFPPRSHHQVSTAAFVLLLAAYVGWMLSLPAWPSQDGPVHLYYTHVLGTLFSGSSPVYKPYLFIKHLLPPYAVYYYTLLALSHVVSLLTADRLIICVYMISFALGFRYAARAIGPGYRWTSLLGCLLLLNWALGMGFANYCLSLSFALWAIGLWLRLTDAAQPKRRIVFLVLLVLITLSHPVPLLIVLAFAGLDLLCRYLAVSKQERTLSLRRSFKNLLTLVGGALCLVYVKAFTVAHPLAQRTPAKGSALHQIALRAGQIAAAKSLALLYGHWWQVSVYRAGLVLLLLLPACLGLWQFRRGRHLAGWAAADTCSVFLILLAVALPFLPSDLSGAYYFSERLTILLWILALFAASAWRPAVQPRSPFRNPELLAGACALAFTLLLLHLADVSLRPIAQQRSLLAAKELPLGNRRVLVLDGDDPPAGFDRIGPAWNAYEWDTVALLRRNDGVLDNAPWLDSPIIPLAPTPALPGAALPRLLANSPFELRKALGGSPGLQREVLPGITAVLFSPVTTNITKTAAKALPPGWTCSAPGPAGYRLCTLPGQ